MELIGIDSETHLISEECPIPELVCVTIARGNKEIEIYKWDDPNLEGVLKDLLMGEDMLALHRASFDMSVFAVAFPSLFTLINEKYKRGQILCTRLYEQLLRLGYDGNLTAGEFSLGFCVEKYLSTDINTSKGEDSWRLYYSELSNVPLSEWDESALSYAKQDAMYTREVAKKQLKVRRIRDVLKQAYCDWLCEMMTKLEGLKIDQEYLEERLSHFQGIIDTYDKILVKHKFKEPKSTKDPTLKKNTKVIKDVVDGLYAGMNLSPKRTDGGAISCDAEALDVIAGKHEGIDALIAIGGASTQVNTFLSNWRGKEYIKPNINVLVSSGRMSCQKPNLQNVSRKGRIRGCFIPKEGYYFCSLDYGQLELLTFAQAMKVISDENSFGWETNMLDAINDGLDLHCLTASISMGLPYHKVVELVKAKDPTAKDERQRSKATNFGLPGGLGEDTLIVYAKTNYGITVTRQQARDSIKAFFSSFPEVKEYFKYINNHLLVSKDIGDFYMCKQIGTDRIRAIPEGGYCAACNTFFQGLAADGVKKVTIDLMNATMFGELKSELKMIIHDEFLFEVPIHSAHEESMQLANIMVESMKQVLPDVKKIKVEPALMVRWEKDAEYLLDANGKLIPWIYKDE